MGDERGGAGFVDAEYIFARVERFTGDGSFGNKGADEGGVVWPDVFGEGGSVVGEAEYVPYEWFSRCIQDVGGGYEDC